jgi:nitrile hydratase subunit beta
VSYHTGQRVRIAARAHRGHHRTPAYLKGRRGTVECVYGTFTNPETRAYGADGLPEQRLYMIGFDQHELWPGYGGHEGDRLCVDIFEHWLEAE